MIILGYVPKHFKPNDTRSDESLPDQPQNNNLKVAAVQWELSADWAMVPPGYVSSRMGGVTHSLPFAPESHP